MGFLFHLQPHEMELVSFLGNIMYSLEHLKGNVFKLLSEVSFLILIRTVLAFRSCSTIFSWFKIFQFLSKKKSDTYQTGFTPKRNNVFLELDALPV